MKAAFFRRYGPPEVLEYGELPDPMPGPGEVLVDIHAASVNAADWKQRAGQYPSKVSLPHIPGRDFSGVVAALGKGASDFKPGDAVFGVCVVPAESAYAEKIALNQEIVARKPERFSHVECAAAGLAALTALISVEDTLQLKAGETVLIHGGAGGVAGFGIQLAKHLGARVISTASASNHDYVRGLGADVVIDYRAQDFTRAVSNCDAVFDTVGGDVTGRSFAVLRPGGRLASIAGGAQAPASPRADVASLRPSVGRSRRHLERVTALMESGALRLPEISLFPLSRAAAAHQVSEARHLRGKLVLQVR
ncbi:MAG TPA: NADP-dependent oxidoreductase [Burkholderiales bacterium]|nr:NADP-dependent oxidoreductase [Burkholderiales bacterium]